MEFRASTVATQLNAEAVAYLTKNLSDQASGKRLVQELLNELGNAVRNYPDWHPILTAPQHEYDRDKHAYSLYDVRLYRGIDHTREFVRGFVTCPYSDKTADKLVEAVNQVPGLSAYRLQGPLYMDNAFPLVVTADKVRLEADGTIRSRDALAWFTLQAAKEAWSAEVAETWWNVRELILGRPHGSRSSLFVNQHTGGSMRKILEALNASGMFGPIKESSLEMLSEKKRKTISETLIRAAVTNWDGRCDEFEFELRGEICKASVQDTWGDGEELSVSVQIGKSDLRASSFYYAKRDHIDPSDPKGKRALAEKFA